MNTLPLLIVVALVFLLLGAKFRIYPGRRLVFCSLLPVFVSLGALFQPDILPVILVLDGCLISVALFDFCTLPFRRYFHVERKTGSIASLQKPHRVTLFIDNLGRRKYQASIRDGVPESMQPDVDQFSVALPDRRRATLHYHIHANQRGAFELSQTDLRLHSMLKLWKRDLTYDVRSAINVYPDMKQLGEYAVLARTNRLSLLGVRRTRKIGQDNEFERLRDYTLDDNYKHIDWKSTARRNKLTVKDFQANQSQRIVFLLDCGRMMTNEVEGLNLLDHSLNAMLMMSYVALRQGDQVGVLCFSDRIHGFVPAKGGSRQMNQIIHAVYDRFPNMVESRYDQAFLHLASHVRKRALVVLISSVIDEVNAHQVKSYLSNLVGRHLPLGIFLRDHSMFQAADVFEDIQARTHMEQDPRIFEAAAASEILTWRHQVLTDLESKGVLTLDTFPEDLTAPLVNRYLDIKARHLL